MKQYNNIIDRLRRQPTMYDQLCDVGTCIDFEAALQVTAFCWANGFDTSLIAYDLELASEEELDDY